MLSVCGILCTKLYLMNVHFSQAPSQDSSFDLASFEFLHLCFVSKELSLFAGLEAVFAETFYHVLVALPIPRHQGQPEQKCSHRAARRERVRSGWSLEESGWDARLLSRRPAPVVLPLCYPQFWTPWVERDSAKMKSAGRLGCVYLLHCSAPSSQVRGRTVTDP